MGTTLSGRVEIWCPGHAEYQVGPSWQDICQWEFQKDYPASAAISDAVRGAYVRRPIAGGAHWPDDFDRFEDDDLCERREWLSATAVLAIELEEPSHQWRSFVESLRA